MTFPGTEVIIRLFLGVSIMLVCSLLFNQSLIKAGGLLDVHETTKQNIKRGGIISYKSD